jgi:hypothetical protein
MSLNPINKKIGGLNQKSGSIDRLQIYSCFRVTFLFEKIFESLGCEKIFRRLTIFDKLFPNWPTFFPINIGKI